MNVTEISLAVTQRMLGKTGYTTVVLKYGSSGPKVTHYKASGRILQFPRDEQQQQKLSVPIPI